MSRSQFLNKAPQPMPGNVRGALAKNNLMDAFRARPAYQQDDYLKWICGFARVPRTVRRPLEIAVLVSQVHHG